jgi:hypothetical protein
LSDGFGATTEKGQNVSKDEDKREPHDIGRIAYETAAAATGCTQPWEQADQAKWNAAATGVLAWACDQIEQEAAYGCPCTEDERLTWENADFLRELGGLPRREADTPSSQ